MLLEFGDTLSLLLGFRDRGLPVGRPLPVHQRGLRQDEATGAAHPVRVVRQRRCEYPALAARGAPAASFNLGIMHLHGEARAADPRKTIPLLERAARAGFATAQFALRRLLETGHLGRRDLTEERRHEGRSSPTFDAQLGGIQRESIAVPEVERATPPDGSSGG